MLKTFCWSVFLLVCAERFTEMIWKYVEIAGLISLHISLYTVFRNLVALVITSCKTTRGYWKLLIFRKLEHRPQHYTFGPNSLISSSWGLFTSFFEFHIHCFNLVAVILHLLLIHNDIVTNQNLTLSHIFSLAILSQYLKLFQALISLQKKACSVMIAIIDMIIPLNFPKSTLDRTKRPRRLKRVITSTFALAEYIYIVTRRETSLLFFQ